jgi:hypothetical protein
MLVPGSQASPATPPFTAPHFLEVLETTGRNLAVDRPLFRTPAMVGTEWAERPFDTARQKSTLFVLFESPAGAPKTICPLIQPLMEPEDA